MGRIISNIIKIFLLIIILIVIYNFIMSIDPEKIKEGYKCNLDKLDIDDLVIINRSPEYIKYINKLIDDKSFLFTDEQLKVLKNPTQFYSVDKESKNISNISGQFYVTCQDDLDTSVGKTVEYFEDLNDEKLTAEDILDIDSSKEYEKIIKQFKNNIKNTIKPDCVNSCVFSDPKYLKNYYLDLYGNNVKSNLVDYFSDYYTNINNNEQKECIPVETLKGQSNFIIPDQYSIQNYFTNAYNVDWSRIVNPNTIY